MTKQFSLLECVLCQQLQVAVSYYLGSSRASSGWVAEDVEVASLIMMIIDLSIPLMLLALASGSTKTSPHSWRALWNMRSSKKLLRTIQTVWGRTRQPMLRSSRYPSKIWSSIATMEESWTSWQVLTLSTSPYKTSNAENVFLLTFLRTGARTKKDSVKGNMLVANGRNNMDSQSLQVEDSIQANRLASSIQAIPSA